MIIRVCDICNREAPILDTIILYKKPIDYCHRCKAEAEKMKQDYKREIDYENTILDNRLRAKERNIVNKLKQKHNKGIIVKE